MSNSDEAREELLKEVGLLLQSPDAIDQTIADRYVLFLLTELRQDIKQLSVDVEVVTTQLDENKADKQRLQRSIDELRDRFNTNPSLLFLFRNQTKQAIGLIVLIIVLHALWHEFAPEVQQGLLGLLGVPI